jgi:predicted Zn-dependent protease
MTRALARPARNTLAGLLAVTTALAASPASAQRIPGQLFDTEMEALLADYARPILERAGQGSGRIRVRILNNPTFNAFVIDGRNIYMHTGVLTAAATPNQVIGVLAHETGHITAAHISDLRNQVTSLQNRSLLLQLLGIGLMVAGALAGGDAASGAGGAGQAVMAGGSETLLRAFLRERQAQEASADQAGLDLLRKTGQSGRGMLETFERLAEDNRFSLGDTYKRTHPLERTRIALLRERAQQSEFFNKADPAELQLRHDMVKAKLAGYLNVPQTVFNMYPAADKSLPARYARAIARLKQGQTGNFEGALADIDSLIRDQPASPYFYEVKGDFLMKHGQAARAVGAFRKATELSKGAPQIETQLAKAIIESGEPNLADEAVRRLKSALRGEDDSEKLAGTYIETWRLLSQAYGAKKLNAEAALAQAEAEVRIGNFKLARERAMIAQRALKPGSVDWLRADDIVNIKPEEPKR